MFNKLIDKTNTIFVMKKIIFLFLFFSTSCFVFAQILNAEKYRLDKDTANVLIGNISFGLNHKSQRTNVFTLYTKANAAYLSKKHSYMLLNNLSIIKVQNADPNNNGYAHLRFNFFRKNSISLEQFNQIQFDAGRGMELRRLTGASVRIRVLSKPKSTLAFNQGLMYENESWMDSSNEIVRKNYVKSTSHISYRQKVANRINLFLISYYQARPALFFKPRLISDFQVQYSFTKRLAFSLQFESTYDAKPVIDIQNHIYAIKNKVNIIF